MHVSSTKFYGKISSDFLVNNLIKLKVKLEDVKLEILILTFKM